MTAELDVLRGYQPDMVCRQSGNFGLERDASHSIVAIANYLVLFYGKYINTLF